ncbi:MAG: hypothetical protein ACRD4U_07640, partial [Candidatus Acidiferrales bacterium]
MRQRAVGFTLLALAAGLLLPATAAAQGADPAAVWAALNQLTIDPRQVATVSGVTLERDAGKIE